jgi:hypothetical protein
VWNSGDRFGEEREGEEVGDCGNGEGEDKGCGGETGMVEEGCLFCKGIEIWSTTI